MIFLFNKIITIIFIITSVSLCRANASVHTDAVSAVLIETDTNSILYEKNAHTPMPMASTTKIMTAICAIESGLLDKKYEIHPSAVGVEGSSIYLKKGEQLTLEELLYGLMLHSGNDAAVAIAFAVSGSVEDFVYLMNETASRIGAVNTHFENPNGLDGKEHYTTAYDLAIITSYGLKNPLFAKIVSTYRTSISGPRELRNHNKLLNMYDGCTGVKTGFTKKCGRCLVSSAKRNGTELVAVTLNDGNDWIDHIKMLDYGFENTRSVQLLKKGEYLKKIPVKGGEELYAGVVCAGDVYITVKNGEKPEYRVEYFTDSSIDAPAKKGDCAGTVNIVVNDEKIISRKAILRDDIAKKQKPLFVEILINIYNLWCTQTTDG